MPELSGFKEALRTAIEVLAAVAGVAGIGLWILHSARLAARAGNPQARAEAMGSLGQVLIGMFLIFISVTVAGFVLWLARRA